MDGRDVMALSSGSSPYFIHRGGGVGVSESGSHVGPLHYRPDFRPLPNPTIPVQSNPSLVSSGSMFRVDSTNVSPAQGISMPVPSGVPVGDSVKKKRGRPRKYAPDGQNSLGLSPLTAKPKPSPGDDSATPKKKGRPPGTGRKQRLANLGEWMNSSAGMAFSTHVIQIGVGEDIVAKILLFSQQRARAVCILSGTGTVSSVTLRSSESSGPTVKFEGRFELLCLSGSYLVAEDGGPHDRIGGISASLSNSDGHVVGGAMQNLIAASPIQVVMCSFVYGSSTKNKDRPVGRPKANKVTTPESFDRSAGPDDGAPATEYTPQNHNPSAVSMRPVPRPIDMRNPNTDIDLMRG